MILSMRKTLINPEALYILKNQRNVYVALTVLLIEATPGMPFLTRVYL